MGKIDFDGVFRILLMVFILGLQVSLGIRYSLNKDVIKSEQPIQPEIELIIKDSKVDTLYVYKLD